LGIANCHDYNSASIETVASLLFVLPGHRRPPPVSDTFGVDEAVLGSHWNDALTFEAAYIEIVLTLCGASELFKNCQRLAKGTSSAKRVTLQFWVKSTITGTYIIELFDDDNTRQVSQAYTISSSNTWEHKTLTFPADTSGALADDNGNSFEVVWGLGMGSTYTSGTLNTSWANNTQANRFVGQVNALSSTDNEFYLTGCQLEIGDVATPFEHRSFHDELRRCKRYFERFAKTLTGVGQASEANCGLWSGMSRSGNSGNNQGVMTYQTKRTNPSISVSSAAHINGVFPISPFAASLSSFGIDGNAGIDNCFVNAANNASSAPSSDCGSSGVMGNSSGTLDIDAEL